MTDDSDPPLSTSSVLDTTTQAIDVFLASRQDNGSIAGIGYWQVANGYTAMILHELWSHTSNFVGVIRESLEAVESAQPGFINEFNDDSMWWAIANLELFKVTHEATYLDCAYNIWAYVKQYRLDKGEVIFRDMDMEGAVYWTSRDNETQLNTITTGLFAELSARLSAFSTGPDSHGAREEMISLAQGSLAWILRCRFDAKRKIVLDTIDYGGQGEVKDWTFTYTTGQTIAASIAIHEALMTSNLVDGSDLLALACDLAQSAMQRHYNPSWVDLDRTLSSAEYPGRDNSPWDNNDAVGFKSILLRSLAKLLCILEDAYGEVDQEDNLQSTLRAFIRQQFASLTSRNTNGHGQYGAFWAGPFEAPTSHNQLAVLDAMAAVHV
ncbi:hypothetical protein DV735_g4253, partial [Chaetothyriales sp. CBS 134920]